MNMWLEYEKERRSIEYLETEQGFVVYKIVGDECFVEDIYVRPDCRRKGHATALATMVKQVAKERGCKYMSGNISLGAAGAMESMQLQLAYGMKPIAAHNNVITMIKEI